jgi:hypothetical protein
LKAWDDTRRAGEAALGYARSGWPVFPCQWQGQHRKGPLIERGLNATTHDEAQIHDWWHRWPVALIGVPTGRASGFVVLDVDVKRAGVNGIDTLAELGFAVLPDTPLVHTASGGLHLDFAAPDHPEIRNTAGEQGSGIGRAISRQRLSLGSPLESRHCTASAGPDSAAPACAKPPNNTLAQSDQRPGSVAMPRPPSMLPAVASSMRLTADKRRR